MNYKRDSGLGAFLIYLLIVCLVYSVLWLLGTRTRRIYAALAVLTLAFLIWDLPRYFRKK